MATQPGRSKNEIDYRITLGAYVNARLQVNPKAFRIPTNNLLDIYIVRDFLDAQDCAELIGLIDSDNEPSRLLAYNGDQEFRTSHSCNVDPHNETVLVHRPGELPKLFTVRDELTAEPQLPGFRTAVSRIFE